MSNFGLSPSIRAMSIYVERTIEIEAPPEVVWKVMIDVEKWPEWTASMRKIELMGDAPFGKGSSARVAPRMAPRGVWTVTEFEENRSFTWEAKSANSVALAEHVIEPVDGGSRVTLSATVSGSWILKVAAPVLAIVVRRGVRQEAEGLKRRSEEMAKAATRG